jgi:acetyl esterase
MESLRALLDRIGPVWGTDIQKHSQLVKDAYAPLLAAAPKEGVAVTRNVAYGAHPRQVVDLFKPEKKSNAPVLVFVHGGAFVRGDKCTSPHIYDNVMYWFARHGFLAVNIEYRLAPEAPYPAGAEDVASVIAWLRAHATEHGGDPALLHLMGHSAGGTHVGSYAYDPALGYLGKHVRALVLVSARLRVDALSENPNADAVKAYFGDDASRYDALSPVTHGAKSALPVFIINAEYENPLLDLYGLELAHNISVARRRAPRYRRMTGHNHMSVMAHFNTEEETLGREILEFFATLR